MGSPALKRSKEPDSTQGFYNMTLEGGTHSRESLPWVSFPWLWQNTQYYLSLLGSEGSFGLTVSIMFAYPFYFRSKTRQDIEAGQGYPWHLKASKKQERRERKYQGPSIPSKGTLQWPHFLLPDPISLWFSSWFQNISTWPWDISHPNHKKAQWSFVSD